MNYAWEITKEAQLHFDFWLNSNNKSILKKIDKLVKEIDKSPRIGIGKPELLKRDLSEFGVEGLILNTDLFTILMIQI